MADEEPGGPVTPAQNGTAQTNPAQNAPVEPAREAAPMQTRYGALVVLVAVAGLFGVFVVVAIAWKTAEAIAALGAVTSAITAVAGAFFGIQISGRAADTARQAADTAHRTATTAAGVAETANAQAKQAQADQQQLHTELVVRGERMRQELVKANQANAGTGQVLSMAGAPGADGSEPVNGANDAERLADEAMLRINRPLPT